MISDYGHSWFCLFSRPQFDGPALFCQVVIMHWIEINPLPVISPLMFSLLSVGSKISISEIRAIYPSMLPIPADAYETQFSGQMRQKQVCRLNIWLFMASCIHPWADSSYNNHYLVLSFSHTHLAVTFSVQLLFAFSVDVRYWANNDVKRMCNRSAGTSFVLGSGRKLVINSNLCEKKEAFYE